MQSYDYAVQLAQEAIGHLAAAGSIFAHDDSLSPSQQQQGTVLWDAAVTAEEALEAIMNQWGPGV